MTMTHFPIGEAGDGPEPGDNADETWHVHDDGTWGWSIHCGVCYVPPRPMGSDGPYWNINWLRQSNEAGTTANEMRQEIYEGARESGRDLQRAR